MRLYGGNDHHVVYLKGLTNLCMRENTCKTCLIQVKNLNRGDHAALLVKNNYAFKYLLCSRHYSSGFI